LKRIFTRHISTSPLSKTRHQVPSDTFTRSPSVNAKLALECGYTAARSGGCLFNVDVWLKKAIENDLVPGPRFGRQRREIAASAGSWTGTPTSARSHGGLVLLINGPDEARAAVRKLVKDGVEWVKTYPTGDAAAPDTNDHHTLCMTFEEMHGRRRHGSQPQLEGHRPLPANAGIKNALRAGYDTIEHGTFMDREALDLLLERNTPACRP